MRQEETDPVPMRIYCKDNPYLNVAIRGDKVLLLHADPNDKSQHWFKRCDVGRLTDVTGRGAFALVNRTTGQAMVNGNNQLGLALYSGHVAVQSSMLWSQGAELEGGGYAEIRMFSNISQTLNGLGGNCVHGRLVGLYDTEPHAANAIWRIDPIVDQI